MLCVRLRTPGLVFTQRLRPLPSPSAVRSAYYERFNIRRNATRIILCLWNDETAGPAINRILEQPFALPAGLPVITMPIPFSLSLSLSPRPVSTSRSTIWCCVRVARLRRASTLSFSPARSIVRSRPLPAPPSDVSRCFVSLVNALIGDLIYLLEEALNGLGTIHRLQIASRRPDFQPPVPVCPTSSPPPFSSTPPFQLALRGRSDNI